MGIPKALVVEAAFRVSDGTAGPFGERERHPAGEGGENSRLQPGRTYLDQACRQQRNRTGTPQQHTMGSSAAKFGNNKFERGCYVYIPGPEAGYIGQRHGTSMAISL